MKGLSMIPYLFKRAKSEETTMLNRPGNPSKYNDDTQILSGLLDFEQCVLRAQRLGIQFTRVFLLDPALAEHLVSDEINPDNRAVKAGHADGLGTDIKNDRYQFNGEVLIISEEGQLNDGQHRCIAVLQTGKTIKTNITFGFPRKTRFSVNQASMKRPGDYVQMMGIPNGFVVAAVARLIWQYEKFKNISHSRSSGHTRDQVNMLVQARHTEILKSVHAVPKSGIAALGGLSLLAFCHYQFSKLDAEAADVYIAKLILGDGLARNEPAYVCRQRLINREGRMSLQEKCTLIWRGWNCFVEGKSITKLKVTQADGELPKLSKPWRV